MNDLFLGVDGGQSSTTVVIGDTKGNIVGWGSAGASNHVTGAEARAKSVLLMPECLSQADVRAGLDRGLSRWHFKAACLGMSGGPDDKATLLHELIEAEHTTITH